LQRIRLVVMASCLLLATGLWAQKPPLLPEREIAALANELSGETAKRNLEGIARFHRQRGSKEFHEAAEFVAERLRAYGLSDVAILQFPADGKIFYGTQRSRPAWDAEKGDLAELEFGGPTPCRREIDDNAPRVLVDCLALNTHSIASYEAEPVVMAEDSESADIARADLIDAGEGIKESDYAGKDVKGKIVLVSAQPGAVQDLAVGKFGAAGIVSYAQNQKTAWWGENQDAIRWGHLETFSKNKTFAFMVSLKTARGFKERLANGERITLHAVVKAGQHAGNYEVVTATIPGVDPRLKDEEIAFSCHLDHERPGANDNASGCVTILEVARTLQKLINGQSVGGCREPAVKPDATSELQKKDADSLKEDCSVLVGKGALARPARTIRFIFPPEIEGTMALLTNTGNEKPIASHPTTDPSAPPKARTTPELEHLLKKSNIASYIPQNGSQLAKRIKAVIHMDMVGGGPETKAVFHVTRGPLSLPSFVHDVAWAFAGWLNEESYKFAAAGKAEYPMVAPEGGKEPLRAEYSAYTMGSDHDVYQDSSFGIPAIYLNDWPDRYIHTNLDSAANIDPTKLKRAAFIGAASGYFLALMSDKDVPAISELMRSESMLIAARIRGKRAQLDQCDGGELERSAGDQLRPFALSILRFVEDRQNTRWMTLSKMGEELSRDSAGMCGKVMVLTGDARNIFRRTESTKGPLSVFGYDYFAEHAKTAGIATPKLLSYEGLWGSGEEYAYEVLNFADGKRNVQEIRDAVSAEYGPVPLEMVVEYLKTVEKIGVIEAAK
jgi:aminopeptidase YwaD